MAKKLNVSVRMYRHYEDNELPLPSDLEQFLSEEEVKDIKLSYFRSKTNIDAFQIDIRKIISYKNGVLQIQLNKSYMDYLSNMNKIMESNRQPEEKKHELEVINADFCLSDEGIYATGQKKVNITFKENELSYKFVEVPYAIDNKNTKKKSTHPNAQDRLNKLLLENLHSAQEDN